MGSSALHLYIDPCATPEQLSFHINEYSNFVGWIGILGNQPWLTGFDNPSKGTEVVKGQWFSSDDRNRLTSLTPANCDSVLWLYASDVVRFPHHLLIRGKEKIDYISSQVSLEPDLLGRTIRYRYYPRLVAKENFNWQGLHAPYLKIKPTSKVAINRKSTIQSNFFNLPAKLESFQDIKFIDYEEIIELLVFDKLNLINSLPALVSFATNKEFPRDKASLMLAQAARFLMQHDQWKEAKGALTLAQELGSLTVFHYFLMAQIAYHESDYNSVLELVDKGLSEPWPQTEFPIEPVLIRTKLCELYAKSAVKLGLPEEAKASLLEVEQFSEVSQVLSDQDKQALTDLCGYQPKKREIKIWPKNSVVYFCGQGLEPWDDSSLDSGIGGSESAVIYLSREWSKAGYQVTVFGSPLSEHKDKFGVEWLDHSRCHSKDHFDIFISWRNFGLFDQPVKARVCLIDCHDLLTNSEVDALRLSRLHRIMVKSKYHKNNLHGLTDCQFKIISNGIDLEMIKKLPDQNRNLKKIIYASSYDRGLELMLRYGWQRITNRHPDAELHIYYGWDGYDKMPDPKGLRARWKEQICTLMKQPGVFDHGRVGHAELLAQKKSASLHYYASTFEEIDCISVRESAAVGCLPVTTQYAALAEKEYSYLVSGDPKSVETQKLIADQVSNLLGKDLLSERARASELAVKESWSEIASRWIDIFENNLELQS